MEHIKKLLAKRLKQSGFSQQVKTSLIIENFEKIIREIFGPNISKKIKPLYLKDKVLTVACLSSVVAQELNFKKNEIINDIWLKLGEETIKDIKIII